MDEEWQSKQHLLRSLHYSEFEVHHFVVSHQTVHAPTPHEVGRAATDVTPAPPDGRVLHKLLCRLEARGNRIKLVHRIRSETVIEFIDVE